MEYTATRTPDGMIHIQNYVEGHIGQHHIHFPESFRKWCRETGLKIEVNDGVCDCRLDESGDVEEYDHRRWHNDRYE
jgi:hypothetical protein